MTGAAGTVRCPSCGECPFEKGVCEKLANRGRRFFLMGALAVPIAAKIEALAPIVQPARTVSAVLRIGNQEWVYEKPMIWRLDGNHTRIVEAQFALAT